MRQAPVAIEKIRKGNGYASVYLKIYPAKIVIELWISMRYILMMQLVIGTTVILFGTAALFAWIQNRPTPSNTRERIDTSRLF